MNTRHDLVPHGVGFRLGQEVEERARVQLQLLIRVGADEFSARAIEMENRSIEGGQGDEVAAVFDYPAANWARLLSARTNVVTSCSVRTQRTPPPGLRTVWASPESEHQWPSAC